MARYICGASEQPDETLSIGAQDSYKLPIHLCNPSTPVLRSILQSDRASTDATPTPVGRHRRIARTVSVTRRMRPGIGCAKNSGHRRSIAPTSRRRKESRSIGRKGQKHCSKTRLAKSVNKSSEKQKMSKAHLGLSKGVSFTAHMTNGIKRSPALADDEATSSRPEVLL